MKFRDTTFSFEERADDLISRMTLEEKASQLLHRSSSIDRLGIPEYNWWNECLHGVARNGKATIFPQAIALAAAFDTELAFKVGTAISDEARAKYHECTKKNNRSQYAGLTFWTPNINIFRDPRWGRGHETYGEDPYLTSKIGSNFVKGLQGDDPKYLKAAACAKHFAVHSGPEIKRHEFDAVVSLKDLNETYLPAFKALVDSGVEAVMGAYNRVNGEPACANTMLMEKLRQEWDFKGHFVSDCWAVRDFHEGHKVTKNPEESVTLALESGCDLNCGCTYEHVVDAVKSGSLQEKYVDEALKRVLMTRFKLGMFDPDENVEYSKIGVDVIDSPKHRKLAYEACVKSIVLLKNDDNVLPITPESQRIYVTGHNAASIDALLGNYYGLSSKLTTVLEGIAHKAGHEYNIEYHPGCIMDRDNLKEGNLEYLESRNFDLVLAVVGLSGFYEGEEDDAHLSSTAGDRDQIALPSSQVKYLNRMFSLGKPVVVVVLAGSAIDISAIKDKAAAIVWAWYPGQEGGNAIADILFGDISPSGKLPITFVNSIDQLPDFEDYSMAGRTYRYLKQKPLYPFGYGLSYASFEYSNIMLSSSQIKSGQSLNIFVEVENTGHISSDEVVQVYLKKTSSGENDPLLKLVSFKRVHIKKGETITVNMKISAESFEYYKDDGTASIQTGTYELFVGSCQPGYNLPFESAEIKIV